MEILLVGQKTLLTNSIASTSSYGLKSIYQLEGLYKDCKAQKTETLLKINHLFLHLSQSLHTLCFQGVK